MKWINILGYTTASIAGLVVYGWGSAKLINDVLDIFYVVEETEEA